MWIRLGTSLEAPNVAEDGLASAQQRGIHCDGSIPFDIWKYLLVSLETLAAFVILIRLALHA